MLKRERLQGALIVCTYHTQGSIFAGIHGTAYEQHIPYAYYR